MAVADVSLEGLAKVKKRELDQSFFKKGIFLGLFSGITYGLYSAFITAAQNVGVWSNWWSSFESTSFIAIFIFPTIASALNDLCSAIWALVVTAKQGKLGDFTLTLKSKPGRIMIGAALVGGPIATTSYIIALSQAGPIASPVAALNVTAGAIFGRVLYKQKLSGRTILGIATCLVASIMIGSTALTGEMGSGVTTGLFFAVIAALGWGLEGTIAGFGTSMIDFQIGITIRQCTSGIANLCILLPVLSIIGNVGVGTAFNFVGQVVTNTPWCFIFLLSGFFAYISFASWYKGNSMCGSALGQALNGTYTFFAPLFTWIVVGIAMGLEGYSLAPIAWLAAIVMMVGIFIIAVNPKEFSRKEENNE
ncbi:MAG: hypothetical protein LIV22_03210 [Olegusella sp.]|nr:hypothetical protein [Olegusella sp.]